MARIPTWLRYLLSAVVLSLVVVGGIFLVRTLDDGATGSNIPTNPSTTNNSKIEAALVATGIPTPLGIVSSGQKDDDRLFIVSREGLVTIIEPNGKAAKKPFLDIRNKVLDDKGEMGLLGLVFDPDYATNGYIYINYVNKDFTTVIARYKKTSGQETIAVGSEKVLIKLRQPYANHNGGDLHFGPDGYLYIALGDGGAAGDPQDRAQKLNNLFGKILRIDVKNKDTYAVPADNPFVSNKSAKPEIWAYGLRNPWRFSFDKKTGDMYIGDVGQTKVEEIDFQASTSKGGENYGWRCFEGSQTFNQTGCKSATNYQSPIIEYGRDKPRCSVTGGYIYRGNLYSELNGSYFYADFCSGEVFKARPSGNKWQTVKVLDTPYRISSFGQDSKGEIYLTDMASGSIYRLQSVDY